MENAQDDYVTAVQSRFYGKTTTAGTFLLFLLYRNAVAVNTKTGEEQEGPFNLMALSFEMRYIDNEPIHTYVLVRVLPVC